MSRTTMVVLVAGFAGLVAVEHLRERALERHLEGVETQLAKLADRPAPTSWTAPVLSAALAVPPSRELPAAPPPQPQLAAPVQQQPPEDPTPESSAALDEARQTLSAALDRRRLTREDLDALRAELSRGGDPAQSREVARQIAAAVTRGELVPEDPHHIFP